MSKVIVKAIEKHKGFEIVKLPDVEIFAKIAYNKLYSMHTDDVEIELEHIYKYERELKDLVSKRSLGISINAGYEVAYAELKQKLKFHYKQAISILSPKISVGWNRWSENILDLFISDKPNKVCWGSGNCGKSIIFAMLIYVEWRVKPSDRMAIIASSILKDSNARVIEYIIKIHLEAPVSNNHKFSVVKNSQTTGIFSMIQNKDNGKWVIDNQACIINLKIRSNSNPAELGDNLLGYHPKGQLRLCFDESQEVPGILLENKVIANWYTNPDFVAYFWGNPKPVDYNDTESWDMLFKAGASFMSEEEIRKIENSCGRTGVWNNGKHTEVLHLCMLDSPKDDVFAEESIGDDGRKISEKERLFFLAGKDTVARIRDSHIQEGSSTWFSQVLGFPFLDMNSTTNPGVLNPLIIKEAQSYPLDWYNPDGLQWFMGVDASGTGNGDDCAIVVGKTGMMRDGRQGVDLMHGKWCSVVQVDDDKEFTDSTIDTMYELCKDLRIPLCNVAVETHGSSEVLRYGLQKRINEGWWKEDRHKGYMYHIVNPTSAVTDRLAFKIIGHMQAADQIYSDFNTELWCAVRCGVITKQIFNIPEKILKQFYNRRLLKNSSGVKYKIEGKKDMKKRGVSSPNDADAMCNMFELIRLKGFKFMANLSGGYKQKFGNLYSEDVLIRNGQRKMNLIKDMLGIGFGNNKGYNYSGGL